MGDKQLLLNENKISKTSHKYKYGTDWRAKWLRLLSKPEIFLINFSIVAIFQGAIFSYMIGSLSTLEKRYSFDSKISGLLLIADNVSQVIISPLIGYLGNKYNRPRIMAIGELVAAFSCFVFAAPYFIFGASLQPMTDIITNANSTHELCHSSPLGQPCNQSTVWSAVTILWIASFLNGIGCTAFYTIGIPYIDDNTSKKNSPIFLSTSAALRLFGPALGLLLSSYTLKFYENPQISLNVQMNDPRWIGCWWIGFVIIGVFLMIFSIPLAFFPTQMSEKQRVTENRMNSKNQSIKSQITEILSALHRLATNPVFVFHVLGISFKLFGYLGYYVFKPKYIESQFRKSASDANFWAGVIIIPTMAFGIISSGFFLSKMKPKARSVALYIFVVEIVIAISVLYAKTFQCPIPIFPQINSVDGKFNQMDTRCNADCHCSHNVFQPVCSSNQQFNYFSPCHAGCTREVAHDTHTKNKVFLNCKCDQFGGKVSDGYCDKDCNQFTSYVILFSIVGVITSTGKIGDTLITLRCIEPKDKNFAIGVTGAFLAIFTFIPFPLIFGAITDSTCKIWKHTCGKVGNCWLYDIEKLTDYLHYSAFGFMFLGAVCRFFIVLYADRISNMFEDEDEDNEDQTAVALIEDQNNFEDIFFKQK